jgi:hypothetical protein
MRNYKANFCKEVFQEPQAEAASWNVPGKPTTVLIKRRWGGSGVGLTKAWNLGEG